MTSERAGGSPEVTDGPTTGDGAMDDLTEADVHDLPETASTDRVHRLERDCWCEPEVIEQQAGWAYVVHHTVQEVLAAHADAPMNPPRAGDAAVDLTVAEAQALARRVVARHLSADTDWLLWEDYPMLSELAFVQLAEAVEALGQEAHAAADAVDRAENIDSLDIESRATRG